MTGQALTAGPTPRRRVMFGLLDADGWPWASLKAAFWFVVIIFMLGYIPDRAYYLTVFSTIDLGINAVSPVNLCPPENKSLPCPAPPGAVVPWEVAPPELSLPAPRTDGEAIQVGHEDPLHRRERRAGRLGQGLHRRCVHHRNVQPVEGRPGAAGAAEQARGRLPRRLGVRDGRVRRRRTRRRRRPTS